MKGSGWLLRLAAALTMIVGVAGPLQVASIACGVEAPDPLPAARR